MAETFEIQIDDTQVREMIDRLLERTGNLRPAMAEIGEILKTSVVRNFESGGRYSEPGSWRGGSRRWQPLAVATLFSGKASKFATKSGRFKKGVEEKFKNRSILFQSGRLMNSVNWRAGADSVRVGTNLVYAAIHNFGGMAGRGRKTPIPARPFMVAQDEDMRGIMGVLMEFVTS